MAVTVKRRTFVATVGSISIAGLAGCSSINGGSGGTYPAEEITVVVPFGAGGGTDSQYRGFKPYLDDELGVNTVVDNRPGATGRTGFNYLSRQDADGYTVGVISVATGVLGEALFDTQYSMRDLTSVGTVSAEYFGIIAQTDKYESINALSEVDGEIIAASTGRGSSSDFSLVSILDKLGVNFRIVPFDSGQELSTAVASGDADIGITPPSTAAGLIEDGRLELLFIDRPDNSPRFSEVATRGNVQFESPGIALELGMFGPPGIEDARVETLSGDLQSATEKEEYQQWVENQGLAIVGVGPDETSSKVENYRNFADRYVELREE
jgi:tripartite-type tricarboxylate transporter receptor subunit TctC